MGSTVVDSWIELEYHSAWDCLLCPQYGFWYGFGNRVFFLYGVIDLVFSW